MAKAQKTNIPPNGDAYEVTAPKALEPLMKAFHVDSEEAANALVMEAAKAIFGCGDIFSRKEISEEELNGIASLMRGISPKDTLETLYAAQIVASHMLGMRKLSSSHFEDQRLGLNLLRFSNEAMQQLEKKRKGGTTQNFTFNYNYHGKENTITPITIPQEEITHANSRS